ncbi:MAG: ribokinase [Tissierellales bacterium]|nr:ribokinase [Tissierellales bacterium]MBN2827720.1 ribokinase [Tissierellales bacterium]
MITVLGSLNMDLVIHTPTIPKMGQTIIGNNFMLSPGGKGANQAVAATRLGGQVTMIGAVGQDIFGKNLLNKLEHDNINIENIIRVEKAATGVASITVNAEGDNFIILDPGANFLLTVSDIMKLEGIIAQSKVLLVQLETPLEVVRKALQIAKKAGIITILDPAPAPEQPLDDDLLRYVDIIKPNETECEIITGIKVQTIEDAKKAVYFFKEKHIKSIIITAGEKGVFYNDDDEVFYKPTKRVQAVDTTAAGDVFSGALAVSLSQGKSIEESISYCMAASLISVTRRGAQASIPYDDEVGQYLKENSSQS